jgi:hypothetical protein
VLLSLFNDFVVELTLPFAKSRENFGSLHASRDLAGKLSLLGSCIAGHHISSLNQDKCAIIYKLSFSRKKFIKKSNIFG